MQFKNIKIKNFKSFPDNEITIDLNFKGIKLLSGENGSGKTTIFDAIYWCIYGKSKVAVEKVINKTTGKNCKVMLTFVINNQEYTILRYRNSDKHGNNLFLFKGNEDLTLKGMNKTQEKIEEIIGIDYNAMSSSIILSSEIYKPFLRATESNRLKIFESIFLLGEINTYNKVLKVLNKKTKEEYDLINEKFLESKASIDTSKLNLINYKEKIKKNINFFKEQISIAEKELEELKRKLTESNSIDINLLMNDLDKNVKIKEKISEIENEIEILTNKKKYLDLDKLSELKEKLDNFKNIDVEAEKKKIEENEKKLKINKDKIYKQKDINNNISSITYSINNVKEVLKKNKEEALDIQAKIKNIQKNIETCPTCGQRIEKDKHKEILNEITIKYKNIISELKENNNKYKELLQELEKKKQELEKIIFEETVEIKDSYIEFINNFKFNKQKAESEYKLLYNDIHAKEENNKEINKEIKDLEFKLFESRRLLKEEKYSKEYLENLKNLTSNINEKIKEKEDEIKLANERVKVSIDIDYVEEMKNNISKILKEKKQVEDKRNKIIEKLLYQEKMAEIFSNKDSGFKKYFINRTIDLFNEKVNLYLPFFFDEQVKITFDKNLKETIVFRNKEADFNEFSSGQKTRCEIAIIFSLYLLVRTMFNNGTNLLVFDEILDNNLDIKGVNAVVDLLEDISKDSTIFIVSHKEEYKEKFENVMKIIKDENGFSKVA